MNTVVFKWGWGNWIGFLTMSVQIFKMPSNFKKVSVTSDPYATNILNSS